jgi:uncharacterized OsmC-like protein/alpha/beta superfamily hydrolase
MDGTRVEFRGAFGDKLVGRLLRPAGPVRAYALFAHCFTCSKDLQAAVRISAALAGEGIATLRFDFTGIGESPGDFADTTFSSNLDDLEAAARYLREQHRAPALLVGHSLGGAAVLAVAHRIEEVTAVATIGAPFDPEHVTRLFGEASDELEARGEAEVSIAGRSFRIKKKLLDDLAAQSSEEKIRSLGRSLLILHSPQDVVVDIDNARRIYMAARHPKSYVSLDGADHLLRREADARYVGRLLAAWAGRYLADAPPELPEDERRGVVVRGESSLAQSIRIGPHALGSDEPASVGGEDTGPTPYELLLASLGACTSMTLRMYAQRKKWPLEAVTVELHHDKIHARDCDECETREGKLDDIERVITLAGDLDETQRVRLLEIADRCPVHRTLHSEVRIRTRGYDPG